MPQPIEKLNRVIKALANANRPSPKLAPTSTPTLSLDVKWKIAWMNAYDDLRVELAKLRSENTRLNDVVQEKTERNRLLQEKLKAEWARTDKKSEKIEKLKRMLQPKRTNTVATQFGTSQTNTVATQFGTSQTKTVATQFDAVLDVKPKPNLKMNPTAATKVKAEVQPEVKFQVKLETSPKKYKCPDCSYSTDKKSSMTDHRAEFCAKAKPVKNIQCKICKKFKTRRALRVHLNNYLTGKHKPRGHHAKFSMEAHKLYHDEI